MVRAFEAQFGPLEYGVKRALGVKGFKVGGKVPGYGGGDRVPALLEKGEYVIRKEVAREYEDELEGLNRGKIALDGVGKNHYYSGILLKGGGDYGRRIDGKTDGNLDGLYKTGKSGKEDEQATKENILRFAKGGKAKVRGGILGGIYASKGSPVGKSFEDISVNAKLTPGEFVIAKDVANRYYPELERLNKGGRVIYANEGRWIAGSARQDAVRYPKISEKEKVASTTWNMGSEITGTTHLGTTPLEGRTSVDRRTSETEFQRQPRITGQDIELLNRIQTEYWNKENERNKQRNQQRKQEIKGLHPDMGYMSDDDIRLTSQQYHAKRDADWQRFYGQVNGMIDNAVLTAIPISEQPMWKSSINQLLFRFWRPSQSIVSLLLSLLLSSATAIKTKTTTPTTRAVPTTYSSPYHGALCLPIPSWNSEWSRNEIVAGFQ